MVKTNLSISSSEKKDLIKLFKKISFFIPFACLIIGINFFVDPANLYYGAAKYHCISKVISNRQNVLGIENLDERTLQSRIIENIKFNPQIVILGSSRSMMIGEHLFNGMTSFNNSVSGASIEDYMALFNGYYKKKVLPKTVILGLDPWIFNKNSGQDRWESLDKDYKEILALVNKETKIEVDHSDMSHLIPLKLSNLVSLSYLQSSLDGLIDKLVNRWKQNSSTCTSTEVSQVDDGDMILRDGRRVYGLHMRGKSVKEVEALAVSYASDKPSFYRYFEYDQNDVKLLEAFSNFLLTHGVQVVYYVPPYHPTTYKLLKSQDSQIILGTEVIFIEIAKKLKIRVIGSLNPEKYNLKPSEFYDGMHTRPEADEKIFKAEGINLLSSF